MVYMFTCFRGGVGYTLFGSYPWKTLSGYIQLDRNKFTCFSHSIDWSSTYIKDLDRVDSILLGVSQHKSLIWPDKQWNDLLANPRGMRRSRCNAKKIWIDDSEERCAIVRLCKNITWAINCWNFTKCVSSHQLSAYRHPPKWKIQNQVS